MRADARRNRERLLDVTVGLILEIGGEPTRDAIVEHAGVGIGTMYRHFPDRQSLLHAVARRALERTIGAGEAIVSNPESMDVLREYMHAAIDNGIGVVNMIHPLLDDTDWPDLQDRAEAMLDTLIERNRQDHPTRADVTVGDVVFATIRFGRPLAIGLAPAEDRDIAHGQLDRYVDGLHSPPTRRHEMESPT
jgi:AcrR family transcriptional regulator